MFGMHRSQRISRLTRIGIAAGATASAVALPLLAAGTAHAAETSSYSQPRLQDHDADARYQEAGGGTTSVPHASATALTTSATSTVAVPAAFVTAAAPAPASAAGAAAGYAAPLASLRITEQYGVPGAWAAGHHTGVDLVAAVGTSVKSVAAGTVVSAGHGGAYGNDVIVKLVDGKYALYAHLSSISVSAGRTVAAGEQIGLSGATGHVTGPHLHFEIRTTLSYGSDINPVTYLLAHGVTL